MSKHVKALRFQAHHVGCVLEDDDAVDITAAADHIEKLEDQLRVARKALTVIGSGKGQGIQSDREYADTTLLIMRKIARKE